MVGISLILLIFLFIVPIVNSFRFRMPSIALKPRKNLGDCQFGTPAWKVKKVLKNALSNEVVRHRTHESLDFEQVTVELKKLCKTGLGESLCKESSSTDLAAVKGGYAMVQEIETHLDHIPLHSRMNVWKIMDIINNNTAQPELADLAEFAYSLDEVHGMHTYLSANNASLPLLQVFSSPTVLPSNVTDTFNNSFVSGSQLNLAKYSVLQQLYTEKEQHRATIIASIKGLLQSAALRDKIADGDYIELNGRYCILLKNTHRRGAGIVHGTSNTGKTLYVEPVSIIEPTNELKRLESRYKQEEHSILLGMCQCIAAHLVEITAAVHAVAQIDVIAAKAKLGRKLSGIIPEVFDEGCIRCVNAKHPLLLLRGHKDNANAESDIQNDNTLVTERVVGNSFEMNTTKPALVISGPNAGGKTVVLKTAGLFALMVQHSIPLPVEPGARVDLFASVMADIGDMQSVSRDVSTFSGHLLVCREILHTVGRFHAPESTVTVSNDQKSTIDKVNSKDEMVKKKKDGQCLVLLDEVGTGTDPEQGSALAQSVLERLVAMGARVMATTHYQRIKELAVQDARFQVAAMEFDRNIPTYRMRMGSVGESYALEAARRLKLPEEVLLRADALLDDNSRTLAGLQRYLLKETDAAKQLQMEYMHKQDQLNKKETEVATAQRLLQEKIEALRQGRTEEHLRDIKAKERELDGLMNQARETIAKQLHEAATTNKKKPASFISIAATDTHISALQHSLKTSRVEVEKKVIAVRSATQQASPLADGQAVEVGARLVVLDPNHLSFGTEVFVTSANKGKGRVCVRLAGQEVKMERHLLGVPVVSDLVGNIDADVTQMTPKERRLHRDLLQVTNFNDEDLAAVARRDANKQSVSAVVPRTAENTLDVREAKSYAEVQELVRTFVREQSSKYKLKLKKKLNNADGSLDAFYILHGVNCEHKARLRTWLVSLENVQHASPALLSVGGDAATLIKLCEI